MPTIKLKKTAPAGPRSRPPLRGPGVSIRPKPAAGPRDAPQGPVQSPERGQRPSRNAPQDAFDRPAFGPGEPRRGVGRTQPDRWPDRPVDRDHARPAERQWNGPGPKDERRYRGFDHPADAYPVRHPDPFDRRREHADRPGEPGRFPGDFDRPRGRFEPDRPRSAFDRAPGYPTDRPPPGPHRAKPGPERFDRPEPGRERFDRPAPAFDRARAGPPLRREGPWAQQNPFDRPRPGGTRHPDELRGPHRASHPADLLGPRLSKRMSELGLASRREADEWIPRGWVRVDGRVVSQLGARVRPDAEITLDPRARSEQASRITVLLHKPLDVVSGQAEDGHQPAIALIRADTQWEGDSSGLRFEPDHLRYLAPAGRLDLDSTGLLVLTQDGRVARVLVGEDRSVDKTYLVRIEPMAGHGPLDEAGLTRMRHGLVLDDEPLLPAEVDWASPGQLRVVLREGKKRQIRRMAEAVGQRVVELVRVAIGQVTLGDLPPGRWRYLRADESFT